MLRHVLRPHYRVIFRHASGARLTLKLGPRPPAGEPPRLLLRGSGYRVGPHPLRSWTSFLAPPGSRVEARPLAAQQDALAVEVIGVGEGEVEVGIDRARGGDGYYLYSIEYLRDERPARRWGKGVARP